MKLASLVVFCGLALVSAAPPFRDGPGACHLFPCPCPFNQQLCTCTPTTKADTYKSVTCESLIGSLINFEAPPDVTYAVTGFGMGVFSDVVHLPARYFAVFSSIDSLILSSTLTDSAVEQQWDDHVFDGTSGITSLTTAYLDAVLPPPPALAKLGTAGLQQLLVHYCTVGLDSNAFQNFTSLTDLTLLGVSVSHIADGQSAFAGLEQSLKALNLQALTMLNGDEFPLTALSMLQNLRSVTLNSVGIKTIPLSFFYRAFPNLVTLTLNSNDVAAAIADGALDELRASLTELYLKNVSVTSVPKQIFASQAQLTTVDLGGNGIKSISAGDFDGASHVRRLWLDSNPISNIEVGAFRGLTAIQGLYLYGTSLRTLDLAAFAGMNPSGQVSAYGCNQLKSLTVSDTSKVSMTAVRVRSPAVV